MKDDVNDLISKLIINPKLGIHLGNNIYKIRMKNSSNNKGKSAGFRVITYLLTNSEDGQDINLLIIYDRPDIENISVSELIEIVHTF